jgi:hypothetical protein
MHHASVLTDRSGRTVTDSVPVLSLVDGRVERLRTTRYIGSRASADSEGRPIRPGRGSGAALHAYTLGMTCGNVNPHVAVL